MEFNLTNFVAAVSNNKGEVTAPTLAEKTKTAGTKAITAVKNVTPVTTGKFNGLVEKVNNELNNLDERVWNTEFQIAMVAQAAGVNLPSDEQMKEYRKQWLEEEAARIKAEEEAKKEAKPVTAGETITAALADPSVAEAIKTAVLGLFGIKAPEAATTPTEAAVELEEEAEVVVEAPKKKKPKAKKPKLTPTPEAPKTEAKNPAEWKQCVTCDSDISVVYKHDECPHCRRTRKAEEAKAEGAPRSPRPRIQFDA